MSDERAKIIDRVRALLSKTVENGCTEAEALAAAEKAAKLMEEYELARADVESVKADKYGIRNMSGLCGNGQQRRAFYPVWMCGGAIQQFCNVKVWSSGPLIKIFGSEADTEMATYLFTIIQIAMEREVAAYLRSPDRPRSHHGATLRSSFLTGMAVRINERMSEIVSERKQRMQATSHGNALIVVKDQEVARRFADLGLKLKSSSRKKTVGSNNAFQAGQAAGNRVSFGKPVANSTRSLPSR